MTTFEFVIYLSIVIGTTIIWTVRHICTAAVKMKQIELEMARKEGLNENQSDSEDR